MFSSSFFQKVVYVPDHAELDSKEVDRIAELLRAECPPGAEHKLKVLQ
jgi:hypothetical protein